MDTINYKIVGRGSFSTVYRKSENKVLIKSCDMVKECMSLEWFPDTSLFPKIERVGFSECGNFTFYEEKYYKKQSSLKNNLSSFEWEFYNILRNIQCRWPNLRKNIETIPNKFHHKRKFLLDAIDALSNYGTDIHFEISPRNVTAHNKKLVLLDCFFFESALNNLRRRK